MHSQMERMKAEAMVDIFQFIKAVRIQRAGLVTTQVCIMTISPITECLRDKLLDFRIM